MIDVKFDWVEGGLVGSGLRCICILCKVIKDSVKSEFGSFCVCRMYEENVKIVEYICINFDNFSLLKND